MSEEQPRLPTFARELIDEPVAPAVQVIPDDWTIPQIAEAVVRGKIKLPSQQQQMLKELLPFVLPKKSAVAVTTFEGGFGPALDRAIERSGKGPELRLIEGSKSDDQVPNE